jgi:type II secretory pathway component PulF
MSTTAEKVGRVGSIVFAAVNAVTFCLCVLGFLRARGHFAEIFKEMAVALPVVTQFVLAVPGGVVLAVAILLLALLVAKEWLRPVWIPLVLNALWLAFGAVLVLVFVLAMMLPLVALITKMQ